MRSQPHPYDRRHLKEVLHKNELGDELGALRAWAQAHLEVVMVGALVLAAAAFGGVTYVRGRAQKRLDASLLLTQAQSAFQQAADAPSAAGYAEAFLKYQAITESYPGLPQARVATLGMANADLALGKAAQAQTEYASVAVAGGHGTLAALGALGVARALEAQGKAAQAVDAYRAAAGSYPGSVVADQAAAALRRLAKGTAASSVPAPRGIRPAPASGRIQPPLK